MIDSIKRLRRAITNHLGAANQRTQKLDELCKSQIEFNARFLELTGQIANTLEASRIELWHIRAISESMLISQALASDGRYADVKALARHNRRIYSQHGEDGVISEIFSRIGCKNKTFLEIGVGNGRENTTRFLLESGWKGTWIEGYPANVTSAKDFMQECIKNGQLIVVEAFVTAENINEILDNAGVPSHLDYISVDIDHNTSYIWSALNRKSRAACIEYNCAMPGDTPIVVPYDPMASWDGTSWFGASLKTLENIGKAKDMALVGCDLAGVNAYFVTLEEAKGKFREPFDAQTHYEPPKYYSYGPTHPSPTLPRKWNVDEGEA